MCTRIKKKLKMELNNNNLNDNINVGGSKVTISFLIALSESLAHEHIQLYSSLVDIAGNISYNMKDEVISTFREVIKQYFQNISLSYPPHDHHNHHHSSYPPPYPYPPYSNSNFNSKSLPYNNNLPPLPPSPSYPHYSTSLSTNKSNLIPSAPYIDYSNISTSSLSPPPTTTLPSLKSNDSSYEEALRISEELDRQERIAAEERDRLAAEQFAILEEEEYQKSISFYCEICLTTHLVHGSYTLECGHRFCEEALSGYICSKISSNEVNDNVMICPTTGCGQLIDHTIVRGCTKDLDNIEAFNKYCEFRKDTFIANELQTGSMIRCPTENCNNVFDYSLRSSRPLAFQCDLCTKSYCINCKVLESNNDENSNTNKRRCFFGPGHEPHTCSEQIKIIERDAEVKRKFEEWKVLNESAQRLFEEAMVEKGWKKCPSCGIYIEKNEGCDHMTCKSCKCSFCYVCGKYDQSNPVNRGDCGSTCPNKNKK